MKRIKHLLTTIVVVVLVLLITPQASAKEMTAAYPGPTLISPIDAVMTLDTTPRFEWEDQIWPTKYTVEAKFKNNPTIVFKLTYSAAARCDGTTCSIPSPSPFGSEHYQWHVLNYDATGKQTWSNWEVFTIGQNTMAAPNLRSPGVNATVYGGRPTFKWYPVSGADGYNLNLSTAMGGDLGTWKVDNPTCSPYCEFRLPFDLERNYGGYRWRVQALDQGTLNMSGWSTARMFNYTQLDRVALNFPNDAETINAMKFNFGWTQETGSTYYLLQIRKDNPTEDLVLEELVPDEAINCSGGSCIYLIAPLLPGGDYKWHVRAKNGRNYGRWAAYRTFTINTSDWNYSNDFSANATNWVDPEGKWLVDTGAGLYRGTNNTCTDCFTYYDQQLSTFTMETRIRVVNVDDHEGFYIYLSTENTPTTSNLNEYYRILVSQYGSDIVLCTEIYRNGGGSSYCNAAWTTPNSNLGDWHVYRLEYDRGNMVFSVDGTQRFTYAYSHPKLLDGDVGFAPMDDDVGIEYVEIDWLTFYVDGSP